MLPDLFENLELHLDKNMSSICQFQAIPKLKMATMRSMRRVDR